MTRPGFVAWAVAASLAAGCGSDRPRDEPTATRQSALALDFGDCSKARVATTMGFIHDCALLSDGTVECGGDNASGQHGDGTFGNPSRPSVFQRSAVAGLTRVLAIAAGYYHTCALVTGGTVKCWGANTNGALGDGTTTDSAVPVTVTGLSGVVAIAAGFNATCAVLANGTARCWGDNTTGVLGNGNFFNPFTTPTPVVGLSTATAIAMGGDHACARLSNGTIACWGDNSRGQLGDGTTTRSGTPVVVPGLSNMFSVATGAQHTCARGPVTLGTRNVYCWGSNDTGQLGNGTTTDSLTPFQVEGTTQVSELYSSSAASSTCALRSNGLFVCWGDNRYGQLGNGSGGQSLVPTTVTGGVFQGGGMSVSFVYSCLVTQNQVFACAGDIGQLSPQGNPIVSPTPVFLPQPTLSAPGHVCRPATGMCDVAETCTGASPDCPADGFEPASAVCRPSAGPCDIDDHCTGGQSDCPADLLLPRTEICRASAGPCDAADVCNGVDAQCPADRFFIGQVCRPSAGPCDADERCGASPDCPPDQFAQAGLVCRFSAGPCDADEACLGTAAECPIDAFAPSGLVCHAPANACESVEVCPGDGVSCPTWSWLPNCGGTLTGTVSWDGTPLTALEAAELRVTGSLGPTPFTVAVAPGTGQYNAGLALPGTYRVAVMTPRCDGGPFTVQSTLVDVTAEAGNVADFDLATNRVRVTGSIVVGGAPVPAIVELHDPGREDSNGAPVCFLLTTDPAGNVAGFVPPGDYEALVTDTASGATLGTSTFTATAGQTVDVSPLTSVGDGCTTANDCATGFCVDGVCCASDCAGGDDCQACSIAAGGTEDGVCSSIPSCSSTQRSTCSGPCDVQLRGGDTVPDGITLTFSGGVTSAGEVSVTPCAPMSAQPTGFKIVIGPLGQYCFDINTNNTFAFPDDSSVLVCIRYPESIAAGEAGFQMTHDAGSGYMLNTAFPDPGNNRICGSATSFSPFAIVEPIDAAGPIFPSVANPIVAYANSTSGARVTYTIPTATDAIDGPRPVTCTPAPGTTFAPGKTTVTCTASDLGGNAGTTSFTIWVQYQAPGDGSFFLKPVRPDGSSVFRTGRPVPVKFQLAGASKDITNLNARLTVTRLSEAIRGRADCESDEDGDETDLLFKYRPAKKVYAYRWKTRGESRGTYRLRADLGDEVVHEIDVSLKSQWP